LEKLVQERFNAQDAAYIMDSVYRLTYPTINEVLWGYGDYTKLIALKLNKQIEDIVISGDTVYIDPKQFSGVTKALIHVFRNIADHGIELPEERAEKDKPPMGNIRCHVEKREAVFTVSISDDGKGIDPRTIGQKAVASHLLSAEEVQQLTDEALVNFIFEDNFSTRETVSMLSGRGVGLASVKGHVEALGGTIRVRSKIDAGTEFFMVLPLL
jgi:two-component system chemotaxis sensor kinase CheA